MVAAGPRKLVRTMTRSISLVLERRRSARAAEVG